MSEPREWTPEEIRAHFLRRCWVIIQEWSRDSSKSPEERVEGAVFSLLATLDNGTLDLPSFLVAPYPAPEDRAFCQREGTNWYPENFDGEVRGDIGGSLHALFYEYRPRK
jgi:hypothetical protein